MQQHYVHRLGPRFFVRLGFGCIAFGIVGVAALLSPSVPVWTVAVTWSIGAAGMGLRATRRSSLVMLDAAEPGREGAASAALQLSDQLGFALGTGVAGAAVALGEVVGWLESTSLLVGGGHHRRASRSPAWSSPSACPRCACRARADRRAPSLIDPLASLRGRRSLTDER